MTFESATIPISSSSTTDGSMDLINKRIDNVSECICVWIRELESSGFSTFFYDTESLESKDFYTNEDAFRVEDHIVEVQDEDILEIIHEEGQDDNAGLIGDCTVRLKNGYQLRYTIISTKIPKYYYF